MLRTILATFSSFSFLFPPRTIKSATVCWFAANKAAAGFAIIKQSLITRQKKREIIIMNTRRQDSHIGELLLIIVKVDKGSSLSGGEDSNDNERVEFEDLVPSKVLVVMTMEEEGHCFNFLYGVRFGEEHSQWCINIRYCSLFIMINIIIITIKKRNKAYVDDVANRGVITDHFIDTELHKTANSTTGSISEPKEGSGGSLKGCIFFLHVHVQSEQIQLARIFLFQKNNIIIMR